MARTRKRAPRPPAAAIVTPAVKTEDAMALDAGYTNTAATTAIHGIAELEPTDEIKPESRTVSPSPPSPSLPAAATRASATSITLHSLKYDFDGALMQEDPDFDEDFIPAEGEEIDMTSLAVAAPAPPDGEAATATTAPKRGIDDTDDTGTGVAFEDPAPASKRRRIDDSGDNELALTTTTPTTATAGATTSVGTSMGTLGGGITGHGGAGGSGGSTVDRLPMPLWIEIFTYIGLPGIGRLRAVCRRFDELLEKEHLWRRCRKIHCPDMPKPAFGVKEWDMWALVRGRGCMVCKAAKFEGKVRGEDGVKVYWQFRVRCCEGCFRRSVVKEADLSRLADEKAPAHVMKELVLALPYGLVDASFAWVPTTVPGPPADVERVYWGKDIEDIKQRYDEALQMDAAEEWLKGLEGEGFGHKADADRMEKWEVRVMQGNSYNPSAGAAPQRKNSGAEKGNGQGNALRNSNGIPVLVSSDNPPFQPQSIPTFYQRTRQYGDRSHQEVEDVKARRKADIEARCLKLSPPIPAEVLAHCSAFQASLKIAQPLTEQSWGALLVKILEQRAGAEEHERLRQAQRRQVEQQLEDRKLLESQERDQWVRKERQWEETQAPVRDMILRLADEEMKGWHGKVTFETAPAFAASVLTAVRTRYYEQGGVQETSPVSDSTPASSSSSAPSSTTMASAKPRPLVLENMKFLFDNKIKALTDPCRRELFFCRACKEIAGSPALSAAVGVTIPPPPKLYGFEGVIQHFAAKHTTDMSLGTVVVHWRSVWPEEAPFVVDPNEIKRLMTRPFGGGGGGGGSGGPAAAAAAAAASGMQAPVLIRTNGPPVPVAVGAAGGFGYPLKQAQHAHQQPHHNRSSHSHSHSYSQAQAHPHQLQHHGPGSGPQALIPGPPPPPAYGRSVPPHRQQQYQVEPPPHQHQHHFPGYHQQVPQATHHEHTHPLPPQHHGHHHHHPPPPSSQTHALQPHPHHSHQAYPVSGPVPPFPTNDRNQHYPQHPQSGYPPQSGYHQHQQPPPHVQPPHQQQYSGYPPAYPQAPAPAHAQPQYNAYGQPVANSRPPAGAAYGAPMHQPVPAVPQPDPYEEAAKKEAEAAAAAAAAEKDRKDKIHYIADRAEQMWKNLGGTNKLLEPSIRALLMIHDTYAAFGDKYKGEKLSIQLFHEAIRAEIDGALKFMKLGNYNKFECRSCPKTSTRSFTLPLLFQHFESVHVARPSLGPSATGQGVKPKRFDWLVDMIRLPAEEEVSKMASGRGFDRKRMAAVEKVYPGVFDKKVEAAAESVATAPSKKHASKASMSAAEDFLNNLLPGGAPVSSSAAAQTGGKVDAKKDSSASDGPGSRDNDRSVSTPATVGTNKAAATPHRPQSRPRSPSLSPTPSIDSRRSRSRRRRGSHDEYYHPRRVDDDYHRYPEDDAVGYYPRPSGAGRRPASPSYYHDRYPSPRRYRMYRPTYDDYDYPPLRERYPSPTGRAEPSPTGPATAAIPPPAGGLEYDDPPPPMIPVSGHSREARYPEEVGYRRPHPPGGYPHAHAHAPHPDYYDRVIDREHPPPPPHPQSRGYPAPAGYYDRPPPAARYYDEPPPPPAAYVRPGPGAYYYDEYEYPRGRAPPPPPPVRVYREDYDRFYERERERERDREREYEYERYTRPPPPHARDGEFERRGRLRSRSPEPVREWSDRERRGYVLATGAGAGAGAGVGAREWREEERGRGRSGSSGGGFRGRGGGRGGA